MIRDTQLSYAQAQRFGMLPGHPTLAAAKLGGMATSVGEDGAVRMT